MQKLLAVFMLIGFCASAQDTLTDKLVQQAVELGEKAKQANIKFQQAVERLESLEKQQTLSLVEVKETSNLAMEANAEALKVMEEGLKFVTSARRTKETRAATSAIAKQAVICLELQKRHSEANMAIFDKIMASILE